MIPYLVFGYKTNVSAKGGLGDILFSLSYLNDRDALEFWIADVEERLEDFRTYNQFQLVRVNPSSTKELAVWNSSVMEERED